MGESKPCPFCKGFNVVRYSYNFSNNIHYQCSKCGCNFIFDNKSKDVWNTRPAEDALKAEVEELRYIVKQFEQWRGDDDTGCPKYQDQNYPCGGEKEFKEKFGEDADFDTIECDEWGEGCWVEYYRWKYRQKLNAPDMNVATKESEE